MHAVEAAPSVAPLLAPVALPTVDAWRAAASHHRPLFAPLAAGARIALLSRSAPATTLVWIAGEHGVDARVEPFDAYASCAADIVLAADDAALRAIAAARSGGLFEALRAAIREGDIVCYWLTRRCVLEQLGFDELLDALGFAFMGACR